MKVRLDGNDIVLDLSDEDPEVADYAMDQFEDRLTGMEFENLLHQREQNLDYEKRTITVTNLIEQLVQEAIDEAKHDKEWEEKHNE